MTSDRPLPADDALRTALQQHYAEEPHLSEGFYERTLNRLAAPPVTVSRCRPLWLVYTAAAAIMIAVGFWLLRPKGTAPSPSANETALVDEHPDGMEQQPQTAVDETSEAPLPSAKNLLALGAQKKTTSSPIDTRTPKSLTQTSTETEEEAPRGEPAVTIRDTEQADTPDTPSTDTPSTYRHPRLPKSTTPAEPSRQSNHRSLSLALAYVGTFGTAASSGNAITVPGGIPIPNDTYATKSGSRFGIPNYYGLDVPIYSEALSEQPKFSASHVRHGLPLTFGIAVRHALSGALFAESGLSFTRLTSDFDDPRYPHISQHQRVCYLGIPLRIGYQFPFHRHWSAYSAAGFSIDIPIDTDLRTQDNNQVTHSHLSPSVQVSPSVTLGIQYAFTRHVALYAEPTLQWFIPSGDDVETYRTEHPLQVTLPLGLRINL